MSPHIKYLIIFSLVFIVYSLFRAFYHLANNKSQPKQLVKFLAIRVGLSLILFISLLLATQFGLINYHTLLPEEPTSQTNNTVAPLQPVNKNK